jgi:hypothetical protein
MYLRNIQGVAVDLFSNLNAYKAYKAAVLVVDKDALLEKKAPQKVRASQNTKSKRGDKVGSKSLPTSSKGKVKEKLKSGRK